jgi:hypothetical protein
VDGNGSNDFEYRMPERPKLASYASKFETRQAIPAPPSSSAAKTKASSTNPHARVDKPSTSNRSVSKDRRADPQNLGRMVQYQNIDDIPDGFGVSIAGPKAKADRGSSSRAMMVQDDDDETEDDYWKATSKPDTSSHSHYPANTHIDRDRKLSSSNSSHGRSSARRDDLDEVSELQDDWSRSDQDSYNSSPQRDNRAALRSYSIPMAALPMLPAEAKAAKKPAVTAASSSSQARHVESSGDRLVSTTQIRYPSSAVESSHEEEADEIWNRYPLPSQVKVVPALPCESTATAYDHVPPKPASIDPEQEKKKLFFSKEPRKVEYK